MDGSGRGWIVFSSVVLGTAGIMRLFDAIWALRYHGVLPENLRGAIFGHSLERCGSVYPVVAIISMLSAIAVMNGSQVARRVGSWPVPSLRSPRRGGCPTNRCGHSSIRASALR
jgi:hypothetical protein